MARGITEDAVFQVADDLLARGERPTIERVRRTLGSGSPNTVNKHLESWWKRLGQRLSDGKGAIGDRPPELERAFGQLWAVAKNLAEQVQSQRIRDERAELERAIAAFNEEKLKLEPQRQALKTGRELLQSEMQELRTAVATAQEKAESLAAELKAALADAAGAKRERDRLSAQLEVSRERLEGNTKHFSEKIANLNLNHERQVRTLKRNLEKSMHDQASAEDLLETTQAQLAKVETELATSRANAAALVKSEKSLTERLIEQGRRLDEALASLRTLTGKKAAALRRRARRTATRAAPPAAGGAAPAA